TTTPVRIAVIAARRVASSPIRRASSGASGETSPKQRTGRVVTSPAVVPESPRSRWIVSSSGGTASIGPRRLKAMTQTAISTAIFLESPGIGEAIAREVADDIRQDPWRRQDEKGRCPPGMRGLTLLYRRSGDGRWA